MTTRLSAIDIAALKTGMRLLVEDVGGIDAAASVSRLAPSSIAESYDPHRANRMPAVDVVADLEAVGRTPRVTATLARLAGYRLVPLLRADGRIGRSIAEVLTGSSEVGAAYVAATADGSVTTAEVLRIATELTELVSAAEQALGVLLSHAEREV
jgi:hypothetical protein